MIDGFSSALVARWTIRDYVVDSKGSGFAANAFLSKVVVKSDANNTCQLLTFRGDCVGIRTLAFTVGSVNMVCSIVWALIIAFDDGFDGFRAPTLPRVALIITAIGIAMAMELAIFIIYKYGPIHPVSCIPRIFPLLVSCIRWLSLPISSLFTLTLLVFSTLSCIRCRSYLCSPCFLSLFSLLVFFTLLVSCIRWRSPCWIMIWMWNLSHPMWMSICMFVDTLCFVLGSSLAGTLGAKASGKWIYVAVQILVWFRWLVVTAVFSNDDNSTLLSFGTWTYSSAFLLNAVLAGVRSKWGLWVLKDNHLWSRKLLS